MSSSHTLAAQVQSCTDKRQLITAFVEASHAVIELETTDIEAIVLGQKAEVANFVMKKARVERDNAKKAYCQHVRQHGC